MMPELTEPLSSRQAENKRDKHQRAEGASASHGRWSPRSAQTCERAPPGGHRLPAGGWLCPCSFLPKPLPTF